MKTTKRESELIRELNKLKEENRRLKEDKAENEATYERVIQDLKVTIELYKSRAKFLEDQEKTYEIVKTTLGGSINPIDTPAYKATIIAMDDIKTGEALREDIRKVVDEGALNQIYEEIRRRFT